MLRLGEGLTLSLVLALLAASLYVGWLVRIQNYQFLTVASGSMAPELTIGDVIVTKPTTLETVTNGVVVSFKTPSGTIITHRVSSVNQSGHRLITKGDANQYPDEAIAARQLQGQAIAVLPKLGTMKSALLSPAAIIGLVYLPATAMIAYQLHLIATSRRRYYRLWYT